MVFVEDVARANLLAANREKDFAGECINIGTGESLSNNEILEIFTSKFSDLKINNAPPRPGDVKHTLCCTKKAEEELNFKTEYDLKKGIKKVFDWWGFNE